MRKKEISENKKMKVAIREMSRDELQMAMNWAKDEGWNPGKYDYQAYYALDNRGFLLLLVNDKPIGSLSIVKHDKHFAFIGLFIILPEYRKQGYGSFLWEEGLRRLSEYTSIGLYAVPAQVNRYKRSDFFEGSTNLRWEMSDSKKENPQASSFFSRIDHLSSCQNIYKCLIDYDVSLWGSSRKAFFDKHLDHQETCIIVTFDEKEKKVNGYGMIRPCVNGYRVGPLYADTPESAKKLVYRLISQIPINSKVLFDIPTKNTFSTLFAEFFRLDLVENAKTVAMFKGEAHDRHEEKCYGLASLEIG